jgi:hydroxymethylbilane synthase
VTRHLRVATRGSRLALRQVDLVAGLLDTPVEPVVIETLGDRRQDVPLRAIAGQGAFAAAVRDALAVGVADFAVHSAKDLPPRRDDRLELVAFPERADPRDVLVGAALYDIPRAGTIATGAPRRRAQLAALRPDIRFEELRGNIETRLGKGAAFDAIVVAAAALDRLHLTPDRPLQLLSTEEMVPQVGQGALAIETRHDDLATQRLLASLDHEPTRLAVTAERAFLLVLGGDCDLPAGAHARVIDGTIHLDAVLADGDGRLHRTSASSQHPEHAGITAATNLLIALHEPAGAA